MIELFDFINIQCPCCKKPVQKDEEYMDYSFNDNKFDYMGTVHKKCFFKMGWHDSEFGLEKERKEN